ncbi:MAG: type III-A CRISPR-associated protein Cas10/Csm1 [Candidatus Verstraetearchaeota archaeon]|nr:type III-A CRISPR-associated protein Cas10/Csm1 [Candidatus Verstraetearchaeota archaeon]
MNLKNDRQYLLTVLGALLHDVGKLGWRAEGSSGKHRHEYFSKLFVQAMRNNLGSKNNEGLDLERLSEIVYEHHSSLLERKDLPPENKLINSIISEADRISSMMEREQSYEESPEEPLESIFNRICICEKTQGTTSQNAGHPKELVYLPSIYEPQSIFPVEKSKVSVQDLRSISSNLWFSLMKECPQLPCGSEALVNTIYFLLKKYVSFTLSAGYRSRPSVPLLDHLKSTAAIAASIYQYSKSRSVSPIQLKEKPYTLIIGDMSGIQDFIFRTFSHEESRKNTAKRLRGRSLEVAFIMDAVAHLFLEELDLFEFNILWCTGGQFAILAPKTPNETIERISKRINKDLWDKFGEQLYLAIAAADCNLDSKEDFGRVLKECAEILNEKKSRKFIEVLEDDDSFLRLSLQSPKGRCHACGRDLKYESADGKGSCQSCSEQEEIGQKSVKMGFLWRSKKSPRSDFEFAGFSYKFLNEVEVPEAKEGFIYAINSTDFLNPKSGDNVSRGFIFVGNTVPAVGHEVISFNYLSKMSKGADKLGFAKGDVDNLGHIMHSGVDPVMIWSTSTLSSLLDIFFAGYLNTIFDRYYTYEICDDCNTSMRRFSSNEDPVVEIESEDEQGNKSLRRFVKWWLLYGNRGSEIEKLLCERCKSTRTSVIYTNYSGGDDFLIIGPWDAVLEASIEIREKFQQLASDNPDVGLSIGYTLTDPKFPISITANQLAAKLAQAKDYRLNLGQETFRKDMASLFGDVAFLSKRDAEGNGSKTLAEMIKLAKELESDVDAKEVPRGLVHDLIHLWRSSFEPKVGRKGERSPKNLEKARREVRSYLPILRYRMKRTLKQGSFNKYDRALTEMMPWMLIPASWVSLRTRTRRD